MQSASYENAIPELRLFNAERDVPAEGHLKSFAVGCTARGAGETDARPKTIAPIPARLIFTLKKNRNR